MFIKILISLTLCLFFIENSYSIDSKIISGIKFPNDPFIEGRPSIKTFALVPTKSNLIGGFNKLLPYVLPAPYQGESGGCLFMSHTGIAEWWMAKLTGKQVDLSERYFMNLSIRGEGSDLVTNWRVDTIKRLNSTAINYLNSDYRFTKGWYKVVDGKKVKAYEREEGAKYGPSYNWIDEIDSIRARPIKMPYFEREIILQDVNENQWAVNIAPSNIVNIVKQKLTKNEAPIMVIYNHVGIWHATVVVGFNDGASSKNCPFVSNYKKNMYKRALEIDKEATLAETDKERRRLQRKARKFRTRGSEVESEFNKNGGCKGRGVLYVRDSAFLDKQSPMYDYDLTRTGEEENYNSKIILREYEWLERLSNHIVQIKVSR